MVNRGASHGCITCRQRRVKCDETKPQCRTCRRLGRVCEGYRKTTPRVRFRDETVKFLPMSPEQKYENEMSVSPQEKRCICQVGTTTKIKNPNPNHEINHSQDSTRTEGSTISPSLLPHQQDLAVSFFLTYVTVIGRSVESTRGFVEFVGPIFATEYQDSALCTAVTSIATNIWTRLHRRSLPQMSHIQVLRRALARLQKAINDPEQRTSDATVLAALVLQLNDTLSAVFDQQMASGVHSHGALTLLLHRGPNVTGSKYHANLVGKILHSKVSFCIREGQRLSATDRAWIENQVRTMVPINPSSALDIIGISLADLQCAFRELLTIRGSIPPCAVNELCHGIRALDAQLRGWVEIVPMIWRPRRVRGRLVVNSSMPTYRDAFDLYPSVQICSIWNVYRVYRLILEQVKLWLATTCASPPPPAHMSTADESMDGDILRHRGQHAREVCGLVLSICYSVPFYLGTCNGPLDTYDLSNPQIYFPSHHDLPPGDETFLRYQDSSHYVSKLDHSRHLLLHGPLHIMSVLCRLICLIFDKQSLVLDQIVEPEQKSWVLHQFLRSLYILRVIPDPPPKIAPFEKSTRPSQQVSAQVSEAKRFADQLRQGLWTITVL